MGFKLTDKDNGARKMVAAIGAANKAAVDVGVLGANAGSRESGGVTVGDVATWAEFGIGQPPRSWCRGWVDENEGAAQSLSRRALKGIAQGMPAEKALELVGMSIAAKMQERITNTPGNWKENADSTVKRKGSSTPLVDTGQFRSSITHRVVKS